MARARLPLDPAAVAAANAAVRDKTDPPGRRLDPTNRQDAKLRSEWMAAYNAALAKKRPAKPAPLPHTPTEQRCDNPNYIELRYLDYNGDPVPNARYSISSPAYSASGRLDANGFARIDGVPEISGFTYWFKSDPKTYQPRPPAVPTAGAPRKEAESYLTSIGRWVWGTVQGDFNQDQSVSQIAVNAGLGLIPLVDQGLDIRDLVANIWHLTDFYSQTYAEQAAHPESLGLDYETWLWIAIFLTAIGAIPELGSAVKGVVKALLKKLKDFGHAAGGLSASQLREIWELLIRVANKLGLDPANASRWLRELPGKLDGLMADAGEVVRKGLASVQEMLNRAEAALRRLPGSMAEPGLARVSQTRAAVAKATSRLKTMQDRINGWLKEQLQKVLGGKHNFEKEGGINTPAPKDGSGGNVRMQESEAPPEPDLPKGKAPGDYYARPRSTSELAEDVAERAAAAERRISPDIAGVAQSSGAKLEGWEYRKKTKDSIEDKIKRDSRAAGISEPAAAAKINDSVRYTMSFPPNDYVDGVNRADSNLRSKGYQIVKRKNTWGPNSQYQGINTTVRSPDGELFEVQYHTPDSFATKQKTHDLYNKERELPKNDPEAARIRQQQIDMNRNLQQPPGVQKIPSKGP